MVIWQTPITDRTQTDVDIVKYLESQIKSGQATQQEIDAYSLDLKGSLNLSDLQRIKNNITVIYEVLEEDTSQIFDIPQDLILTQETFTRLINNISTIRDSGIVFSRTPPVPQRPLNTHEKWNDIEKILYDCYTLLTSNFYYYTNQGLYAGQSIGLLD